MKTFDISDVDPARSIEPLQKLNINYEDDVWIMLRNGATEADKPTILDWPKLFRGYRTTLELNSSYRELLKKFAAGMILGEDGSFSPVTIRLKIVFLLKLFAQMQAQGYKHISLMDSSSIVRMLEVNSKSGKGVQKQTLSTWVSTINQLYQIKLYTKTCFTGPPISKKETSRLKANLQDQGYWEAPPEPVGVYLLREAIRFLEDHSNNILDLYESYISAVENALSQGINTKKRVSRHVSRLVGTQEFGNLLQNIPLCAGWRAEAISVTTLISHISAACFIIITFTCGQRVSEIRRASSKSVHPRIHDNGVEHFYYHAARSKRRYSANKNSSEGTGHSDAPWILSPAAVKAFEILVRMSRPAREKSGVDNLWLSSHGNALWPFNPTKGFSVIGPVCINVRLNSFSKFLSLQKNTQWEGRLHSHMGRKHLARFVAKRDRSALGDLAQQYSHISSDSVDLSYARPDSEFRRMIQEELAVEMAQIGVELLNASPDYIYTAPKSQRAESFLGELRTTRDIKLLVSSGVQLLPCQWGVCLYSQDTSACQGTKQKPNIEKRTPKVCSECSNFIATPKHLLWWMEFEADCKKVMKHSNMPKQLRLLLEERLTTTKAVLRRLKGSEHE